MTQKTRRQNDLYIFVLSKMSANIVSIIWIVQKSATQGLVNDQASMNDQDVAVSSVSKMRLALHFYQWQRWLLRCIFISIQTRTSFALVIEV